MKGKEPHWSVDHRCGLDRGGRHHRVGGGYQPYAGNRPRHTPTFPTEWINGNELGSPDAPVVMVAYEDFLCPHCGEFNRNAKARLIEDFIEAGDLRLVYMFFPLDIFAPASYNTARAGQCIIDLSDDPNGFWQYHDTLFFGERGASRYEIENLTALARDAGVNEREFVECFGLVATQDKVDQSVRAGAGRRCPRHSAHPDQRRSICRQRGQLRCDSRCRQCRPGCRRIAPVRI